MDDAGGGRRGRRPGVSPALVDAVERGYGISLSGAPDLGGSANLNVLGWRDGRRVVVRAYRAHVTIARVRAIQGVRAWLAADGIPCAELVPTTVGAPLIEVGPNVVEVEEFVEADAKMDTLDRIAAGLPTLAAVHARLATVAPPGGVNEPPFASFVDPGRVVELTRTGTDRIRSWEPTGDERLLADAADRLADAVAAAQPPFADLPRQLVHGDFWDNNVLFRNGEVVLVADFDFMGTRLRVDDLALTLYFTTRLLDPDRMGALAGLVDAYDGGASNPLSVAERAAMPVALARQPLWSVAVWAAELDDVGTARRHLHGHLEVLHRALGLIEAGRP